MTDKAMIVAVAYDAGTLKRVTKRFAYVSDLRLRFNDDGEVVQVARRKYADGPNWIDVEGGAG